MTHATCRLTAKNRDQLRNPTLGNRVWASFFAITRLLTRKMNEQANRRQDFWAHTRANRPLLGSDILLMLTNFTVADNERNKQVKLNW